MARKCQAELIKTARLESITGPAVILFLFRASLTLLFYFIYFSSYDYLYLNMEWFEWAWTTMMLKCLFKITFQGQHGFWGPLISLQKFLGDSTHSDILGRWVRFSIYIYFFYIGCIMRLATSNDRLNKLITASLLWLGSLQLWK